MDAAKMADKEKDDSTRGGKMSKDKEKLTGEEGTSSCEAIEDQERPPTPTAKDEGEEKGPSPEDSKE